MQVQNLELTLVRVGTPVDHQHAVGVRKRLDPLLTRPGHVVLDLRESRLDSRGLGVILSMQRRLELQGRRLYIIADDPDFLGLLDRTGAAPALVLCSNVDQALMQAQAQGSSLPT
jgi:anti-anti-sigma factor